MMNGRNLLWIVLGLAWWASPSGLVAQEPEKLTFDDNVQAVLRARCSSCHSPNKKSGDLDVTSYSALMQGGSSGAVIEAGNAGESYLMALVKHEDEPKMPPNGEKIPQAEIDLIAKWIDGGVLENKGSKAVAAKKTNMVATTAVDATARPAEVPLPGRIPLEPAARTARSTAVTSLATSPWAPLIAIAAPQQVVIFRTDTLEVVGILPFPEGQVNVVRFSRDGGLVIAGGGQAGAKGLVAVWSVKTGERIATVGNELDAVLAADISNDHSQIAMAGPSRLVRVYSTGSGELLYEIKKHTDWVLSLAFSPDGVLLASADRNGGLFVWEAATGREYLTLRGHTAAIPALSWRWDSNALASCSEDTTIRLWEMENGSSFKSWGAHGGGALDVKYCRDGNLISSGRDLATKLWDQNGTQIRAFPNAADLAVATALCDESQRAITADWQGNITVWNAADAAPLGTLTANPPTLTERLASAQTLLQTKQQELDPVATQYAAVETQFNTMQQALTASREKMGVVQTEVANIQAQMDATTQSMTAMQTEKANLEVALAKTKEAHPLLAESLTKAMAASAQLPDNADLKKAADGVAEQVKQLEAQVVSLEPQIADRAAKIEAGSVPMKQMAEMLAQKQAEMTTATQEVQKYESEIQPVKQQFDTLAQQLAGLRAAFAQAQEQVGRWQGEIDFVAKLNQLSQQLAAAQQVIGEKQSAIDAAQVVVDQAQAGLNAAKADAQQAQVAADEIRRLMDEARHPSTPVTTPSGGQ